MSLTRLFISDDSIKYAINILQNYIINNNYRGFICTDYNNNIIIDQYKKYIAQNFNDNIIFISAQSFQQNHIKLAPQIRKYVLKLLINCSIIENIVCIGGESYIYGLISNIDNIYHYTNSNSIFEDCKFNNKFYRKNIINNLIDYNNIDILPNNKDICLINLSQLNINLIKLINNNKYKKLIIINCNSDDFWKKIILLKNYKLVCRKKFICFKIKYFITITFFIINI
jgi:hypothetical protein